MRKLLLATISILTLVFTISSCNTNVVDEIEIEKEKNKDVLFSVTEEFAEGEQSIVFRNGVVFSIKPDTLYGYTIIIDSLDTNSQKWSEDNRYLVLCDSNFVVKSVTTKYGYYVFDDNQISCLNENNEIKTLPISSSQKESKSLSMSKTRASEITKPDDIINVAGTTINTIGLTKEFWSFCKQPSLGNIFGSLLTALSMADDSEAKRAIWGDIVTMMEIVKSPTSKLGWLGALIQVYQTEEAFRKRYVKQLIGNVSVTIKNVKVEGKNSVVFDYEVKGVSASSEDKPYITFQLFKILQSYNGETTYTDYQLAANGSYSKSMNGLSGGKYRLEAMITPWRFKDNKSSDVRSYFSLYSNAYEFEISPLFLENIKQTMSQYNSGTKQVTFGLTFDLIENGDIPKVPQSGYEGAYYTDYGVFVKINGEYKTYSAFNNDLDAIYIDVYNSSFKNIDYNNFTASYPVTIGTYFAEKSGPYGGLGYKYYDSKTYNLEYNTKPAVRITDIWTTSTYPYTVENDHGCDTKSEYSYTLDAEGLLFADEIYYSSLGTSWYTQFDNPLNGWYDGILGYSSAIIYTRGASYSSSYSGVYIKCNGNILPPANCAKFVGDGNFIITNTPDVSTNAKSRSISPTFIPSHDKKCKMITTK